MKKILLVLLSAAVLAAGAFAGWYTSGYLLSRQDKNKIVLSPAMKVKNTADLTVGDIVMLTSTFKLPRYRKPELPAMTPGKGTAVSLVPVISKVKSSWKYDLYEVKAAVCCIRPGESEKGSVSFEISAAEKNGVPEKCTLAIPALKISSLPAGGENAPLLSDSLTAPRKSSPWLHLLWGLLLLIPLILWLILRKRREAAVLPLSLRQRTLGALETLRKDVLSHHRSAREGISVVSDLLRNYLEERYRLPASGKTTPEFLAETEYNSAIPPAGRSFLRNFLNTADMIKFAQAPCDATAVTAAVDSAVELVENTAVREEEEK